jgi:hypothetical protein
MESKTIASNFFNHPASSASFFLKNENSLTPSSFEFQGDFGNSGIYYDTLEIAFPKNMDLLYKAVSIRHDIVHRNGKDINGKFQNISKDDVEELVTQVKEFVAYIHRNLLTVTTELE